MTRARVPLPLDDYAPDRLLCAAGKQIKIQRIDTPDGRKVTTVRSPRPRRKGKPRRVKA